MSEYHEIIEEDKAYLQEVGMRSILQEFVADSMEDHPENVYEYMAAWATKKTASHHAAAEKAEDDAGDEYPVEESLKGAAHSNDEVSRPDPSLRRHENEFDIGHPSKEVSGAANHAPDPEVSSKRIEEVANAINDAEEL